MRNLTLRGKGYIFGGVITDRTVSSNHLLAREQGLASPSGQRFNNPWFPQCLGVFSLSVKVGLFDWCRELRIAAEVQPPAGGKHAAARRHRWCEFHEPQWIGKVIVYCLHAAAHEVSLVPKAGAARVAQEVLPPLLMGQRASPSLDRFEVPPILAHPGVWRQQGKDEVLMEEKTVRFQIDRFPDHRSQCQQGSQAA